MKTFILLAKIGHASGHFLGPFTLILCYIADFFSKVYVVRIWYI